MNQFSQKVYQWAVIGAGPAGIATVGLLLDAGVSAKKIVWVDPDFQVGDFGRLWGDVSSNTSVQHFLDFLTQIKSFHYNKCPHSFALNTLPLKSCTHLHEVTKPLQWVTEQLRKTVDTITGKATEQHVDNGYWNIKTTHNICFAEKTILATGVTPKSLNLKQTPEIDIAEALSPAKLARRIKHNDSVAVFGSSHSAMIIMRNALNAGAKRVVNFYISPLRYALPMDKWTLYDNSGLKGETASWVKKNISQSLHPRIERYISNANNINNHLEQCNSVIYAIGFKQRTPQINNIDPEQYDTHHGIIAPGLFGAGIAFPKTTIDPSGHQELNVGLWKFMHDIRSMLPIWMRYGL